MPERSSPSTGSVADRLAPIAIGCLPILAWVYLTWVVPRPFYIAEYDSEHLTWFSAWLLRGRATPLDLHNPGLPADYLATAIMLFAGTGAGAADRVFWIAHLVTALLTGASLGVIARFLINRVGLGLAALALAPMIAWPSVVTFFEYFDPIALQIVVGLPAMVLFWRSLEADGAVRRRRLFGGGLALGVCLATKLTFVPLAVAMFLATLLAQPRGEGSTFSRLSPALVLAAGAVAAFVLVSLPVLGEIPSRTLLPLWRSEDIRPPWWQPLDVLRGWRVLIAASWPSAVVVLAAIAWFAVELVVSRRQPRPELPHARSAAVFLALMVAALGYTMAADAGDGALRNSFPAAMCVPLLLVFAARGRTRAPGGALLPAAAVHAMLVVIALGMLVPPVHARTTQRRAFIESQTRLVSATRARLTALRRPGTRIAIWDGSPGTSFGEESFYFWGNYKYAGNHFDTELSQRYPESTWFRLREVRPILRGVYAGVRAAAAASPPAESGSAYGVAGRLWRRLFPHERTLPSDALVAAEKSGPPVSLIAFPVAEATEELVGVTDAALLSLIEERLGPATLGRETIGGAEWIIIKLG